MRVKTATLRPCRYAVIPTYLYHWHRFIDHLAEGKDEKSFFKTLCSTKKIADFAETLEKSPEFDGHTSDDVLGRLKGL